MLTVIRSSWPLLIGILLLMIGNGFQGTLVGVRGPLEGFSTFYMSLIMSAYFIGFLGGSRLAPKLIRSVGHVRVFAALASFISAALILLPVLTDPVAWFVLRLLIGFCFSGVYVTAESWLNNTSGNEVRGQAISLYILMQMVGLVTAQGLLTFGDPAGFILFIIPSVLVSISFAPILLSVTPAPAFEATKPMSFADVYHTSPLAFVGICVMGGVYAAMFGMSAVFGAEVGLGLREIAMFVASFYVGGMIFQYPIGYLSDRVDRRNLVFVTSGIGGLAAIIAGLGIGGFWGVLAISFVIGGMANPLYALLLAYTNDYLDPDDMPSAAGRLIFLNGMGAISGPILVGILMETVGPSGFFWYMAALMLGVTGYAAYRMTKRATGDVEDAGLYQPISPTATPVAFEAVQEVVVEAAEEAAQQDDESIPVG